MICDKLSSLSRYCHLHPNLDTAINFILSHDLSTFPLGRNTVQGNDVFFNSVKARTSAPEGREFEYHRHYIDLHLDLSGSEKVAVTLDSPIDIGVFNEENDGGLTEVSSQWTIADLKEGGFVMVFPGEPHLPLLPAEEPAEIRKCIFKIRID